MKHFIFIIVISILLFFAIDRVTAGPDSVLNYSISLYNNGEYFNAIGEIKRYQYLYPNHSRYPQSVLLLGQAYYYGNNFSMANQVLQGCFISYKSRREGERALYYLGNIRLHQGAPNYALHTYYTYEESYKNGMFNQQVGLNICYAKSLSGDLNGANLLVKKYLQVHQQGIYTEQARELDRLLVEEINRPKKSIAVSVLGSIFIPGFGHFYTGQYLTGVMSLMTNALCIFMVYDGYIHENQFQTVLFSVLELSFYQYSLYSAARNVYEYNSPGPFYNKIRLALEQPF